MSVILTSFFGAFFAFLFIRIADAFRAYYDRQKRNYQALVKYERLINDHLDELKGNIYELDQFQMAVSLINTNNKPALTANWPQAVIFDSGIAIDLTNIDLINDLISHSHGLNRLNNDFSRFNNLINNLQSALLSRNIDDATYCHNITKCANNLALIIAFLNETINDSIELLAKIRIEIRRSKPLFDKVIKKLLVTKYSKNIEIKALEEKDIIDMEIAKVAQESQQKINNIIAK
jgi:hypothetical protein